MALFEANPQAAGDQPSAQAAADRVRLFRAQLLTGELGSVLALTSEQRQNFDRWSTERLETLARQFDVDITASQKRISWGMRIASTLGALAICAAIILCFTRYWGYLETRLQLFIVILMPLLLLLSTEVVSRRERGRYFTGLLGLASFASFVLNLSVVGSVFNIVSTERALLAWGLFAMLLAYRYGLRVLLAVGLLLLESYLAAAFNSRMGYHWLEFYDRPEHFLLLGLSVLTVPVWLRHHANTDFDPAYRLIGALTLFVAMLSLAHWGAHSHLPWETSTVERLYEIAGLILSAGAIWLGISRAWNGIVNTGAIFFVIFLFTRLYHWWWDWMPRYLFFAAVGALGIALVLVFKRVRTRTTYGTREALA